MARSILHKADSRGFADHGWLKSRHTFSFAGYYNPERINFGALRVLNDDTVEAGKGFGTHPHDNMEIISIPLEGDLEHKDNMGNVSVIRHGDIQVMSAGTGIFHSEYNSNSDREVKFLQIWVFPDKTNVEPRYDQITLNVSDRTNRLQQIVSPYPGNGGLWIHQQAWFSIGNLDKGIKTEYSFKSRESGVYLFVLKGEISVNDQVLTNRDGYGIWETEKADILSLTQSEVLLIEVPMLK
jgi:redox-sensitive bicupin YhaK (pirin superfamily)